ncbi:7 TM domain-containing transmembrane protein, partial [Acrasis kona]
MESTLGHALGFFHTSIIMLQGSLVYTRSHLNKFWIVFLEFFVTIHSAVIAYQTANYTIKLLPMFLFGFLFMFSFNQVYDLPFNWRRSKFLKYSPIVIFWLVAVPTFYYLKDSEGKSMFKKIRMVFNIPVAEGLFALITMGVLKLVMPLYSKIQIKLQNNLNTFVRASLFISAILVYYVMMGVGVLVHYNTNLPLMLCMPLFVILYIIGCILSFCLIGLSLDANERSGIS